MEVCFLFFVFFVLQYIWDGGQRGDVHRCDGLQHRRQLGGPDRRHCCHSRTAGQATQYNAQRRGQCVTRVVLRCECPSSKIQVILLVRFLSVAVVWLQEYTSGLAFAPHCQWKKTECPEPDSHINQLQAAERIKQPDQCNFSYWICLAAFQSVKSIQSIAHFMFRFVFIQTGLFPVCTTVYIYKYCFCIMESCA